MNKNLHDIDIVFKKALEDNVELPSSSVWDTVSKRLDKNTVISISKKYNKLKCVAGILLLLSAGMAMYTLHVSNKNKQLVKQNTYVKKLIKQKPLSQFAIKDSLNTIAGKIFKIDQKNTSNFSPGKNNAGASNKIINRNGTSAHTDAVNHSFKTKIFAGNDTFKNTLNHKIAVSPKSLALLMNKITTKQDNDNESNSSPGALQKGKRSNITVMSTRKLKTSNPSSTQVSNAILSNLIINNNQTLPELKSIDFINVTIAALQMNKKDEPGTKLLPSKSFSVNKSKLKLNNNFPLSATIFFSPDLISSNVKDEHPRFREEERNEIKKDEKIQFSSTIGLLLDYSVSKRWKLESGITYSSRTNHIEPKTIYARPDNNGNVNYRFNCSAGYTYIPVNSTPMPASGDSIQALASENTLKYIGVPLTIRYTFIKNKWSFLPTAGVSFNFLTQGQIETTIAVPAGGKSTSSNKIQGLKSSYLNGIAGVAARYSLNKLFSLSFEPAVRFALSSINNEAPVKTNLNSVGFVTGLVIKL